MGGNVGWCSAEALPNGGFLVATMQSGQVRELTPPARFIGQSRCRRLPCHASPYGHTLVASMTTRIVAEFDRNGNVCWKKRAKAGRGGCAIVKCVRKKEVRPLEFEGSDPIFGSSGRSIRRS